MRIKTATPEQTQALGVRLGRHLKGLDLICLFGDLGSGKTTLTKGIARGAGFRGRVVSPTFGLARVYRGPRWMLYHLDLYRVATDETGDIGIDEYVGDPRGICVVEWPEAGARYYPPDRLEVRLAPLNGRKGRTLSFKAFGPRSRELLRTLRA